MNTNNVVVKTVTRETVYEIIPELNNKRLLLKISTNGKTIDVIDFDHVFDLLIGAVEDYWNFRKELKPPTQRRLLNLLCGHISPDQWPYFGVDTSSKEYQNYYPTTKTAKKEH